MAGLWVEVWSQDSWMWGYLLYKITVLHILV